MTKEEAINILKATRLFSGRTNGKTVYAEALNMAINALQAQPTAEQIQKMQDIEQAQLEKAHELGKAEGQNESIRCNNCSRVIYVKRTDTSPIIETEPYREEVSRNDQIYNMHVCY